MYRTFLTDAMVAFISHRCRRNRLVCSRRYRHASEKNRNDRESEVFPCLSRSYISRPRKQCNFASVSIVSLLHRRSSRFLFTRGEKARWSRLRIRELICCTQRRCIKRRSFRYIWFVIYLIFPSRWGCNFPPSVTAALQS